MPILRYVLLFNNPYNPLKSAVYELMLKQKLHGRCWNIDHKTAIQRTMYSNIEFFSILTVLLILRQNSVHGVVELSFVKFL